MEPLLKLVKNESVYCVYFYNDVYLGNFEKVEDGYYVYWPELARHGYFTGYVLEAIADKLYELNKDWDRIVQEDFSISLKDNG